MVSPVNVSTKISVGFEDQFSAQACQAFEAVKKCAEDAFKVMGSFPKSLAPGGFQGDVALFSQSVEKFESSINRMNEGLIGSRKEVIRFGDSLENPGKFVNGFLESMKQEDTFKVTTNIADLTIALTGLGVVALATKSPLIALGAIFGTIGLGGAFLVSLLNDIEESLRGLDGQKLIEPKISENSILQLERFSSSLKPLVNMGDFQFKVGLQDDATASGAKIRQQLEEMFKPVITQTITTERVDNVMTLRKSFGSDSFFDGGAEFLTSSKDLTGFSSSVGYSPPVEKSIPGFSTGIDRVPRDMLAMIHKDETVLPKNRAEDFRRGGSSGMTIQNLEFNFNVPNGLKLDREEFSELAFMMRDELKRLDERMS